MLNDGQLTLRLAPMTESSAYELAQFCKRVTFSEVRACAVSDDNATEMMSAIICLQEALEDAGYAPR